MASVLLEYERCRVRLIRAESDWNLLRTGDTFNVTMSIDGASISANIPKETAHRYGAVTARLTAKDVLKYRPQTNGLRAQLTKKTPLRVNYKWQQI